MAVVVPNRVLFRGSTEDSIRQKLVEHNLLDAVIGLPEKLFLGTGIPAAILVFRKRKPDDSVIFIDASRDYEEGANQNRHGTAQVDKIAGAYLARETVDKYTFRARQSDIRDNDFNLNLPR